MSRYVVVRWSDTLFERFSLLYDRFRITVTGNFFNLDSHFAKAGKRLRSGLHGGGGPQVSEVTRLGRVTRRSLLQSLLSLYNVFA